MISEVKSKAASVGDSGQVRIRVVIGDAQAGGWAIQLGSKVIKGDDFAEHPIGSAAEVRAARFVQVATVVRDVRPETDHLSAIITLVADGSPPTVIDHSREGAPGEAAQFTSIFVVS